MNPTISKRISICNIVGAILIVLLHSSVAGSLIPSGSNFIVAYAWFKCINIISDIAVPTFFAISGFLFFKDYSHAKYLGTVKQRIRSLIVPYFCFSFLLFIYYCVLSLIPALNESSMDLIGDFSIKSIIKTLLWAKCDPPIWYLRVLFILVVISPIFDVLIRCLREKTVALVVIISLFNIAVQSPYSSPVYWCPVFLLGAICATQNRIKDTLSKEYSSICVISAIITYVMFVIMIFKNTNSSLYYIYRMIVPVIVWVVLSKIQFPKRTPFWFKTTFFVFCTHYPVSQIIRVVLTRLLGGNNMGLVFVNILTTIAVVIVINVIAYIMQKKCRNLWITLNGGR